ncbi:hypothetical protein ABQ366_05250 [Serratia fonticola]|uniref:hypothetical protein n=1 Tax=Serratia fonticola TaxID=47917 RepID=UPI003AB0CC85
MNLMDRFEEDLKRETWLELLKSGAEYFSSGSKISEVYDSGELPTKLDSFFRRMGKIDEVNDAISWWRALPPDKKAEFDR